MSVINYKLSINKVSQPNKTNKVSTKGGVSKVPITHGSTHLLTLF